MSETIGKELPSLYLKKLDQWVTSGGDVNSVQKQVLENCGKFILLTSTATEAKAFATSSPGSNDREEFDFRVDVCVKITVHRVHPQPEFAKPELVKLVCGDGRGLFRDLCQRANLR